MNQLPHSLIRPLILRFGPVLLLAGSIGAQNRVTQKPGQSNTNSTKRTHVATLRSSDSTEGSRVAISSDQSLNNYEAYRRGDRFYVKIPPTEVPRAEATRGRGFADVKAQRSGDSTVLSFRLQPGATAHVEQRGNKLDVVVSVPGGGTPSVASNRTREAGRPNTSESLSGSEANKRGGSTVKSNTPGATSNKNANSSGKNTAAPNKASTKNGASSNYNSANNNSTGKAPANRSNSSTNTNNSNNSNSSLNSNKTQNPTSASSAKGTPTPMATPSPQPSPSAKSLTPTPPAKSGSTAAIASPTQTATPFAPAAQSEGNFWARTKARAHYWLLLAQLNPLPVAIGTFILLVIIGLLLFQRRRARATRRVKQTKSTTETPIDKTGALQSEASSSISPATEVAAAAAVATAASTENAEASSEVAAAPSLASSQRDDPHKQRAIAVADEAKKVFAGEGYDQSIVGSDDVETRRLVGAELASALVGRDPLRRERAREAFMKHGYFDDATRDLRVAESPNERAAAARRLSFVNDRDATPHLIGALSDPEPDVRRAAVEAMMDLRDPAAIAPLNSLLQTENDRKVPHKLIQQAIDACATGQPEATAQKPEFSFPSVPNSATQPNESEREVIEL